MPPGPLPAPTLTVPVGELSRALRISRSTLLRRIEAGTVAGPDVQRDGWRRWSPALAAQIVRAEGVRTNARLDVPSSWGAQPAPRAGGEP